MNLQATSHPWLSTYPTNIRWDTEIAPKPLFSLLDETERLYAARPCIDFLGKKLSFAQVAGKVRALAYSLRKLGVEKGVRVGLFLPNSPHYVISYYAILKAGGTVVNFNPLYSSREIKHQIEDSGAKFMITLGLKSLYPKIAEFLDSTQLEKIIVGGLEEALPFPKNLLFPFVKKEEIAQVPKDNRHVAFKDLLKAPAGPIPVEIDPLEDIAVLQYTGGTTGTPKAAMLTHANLYSNALQCGMWFEGLKPGEERMLGVLPLFHVFAMTAVMNLSVHKGACMILHPKFEMKAVLEDIQKKKPTLMPGVPAMFTSINNFRSLAEYDISSLKMCISGGAPLPQEVKLKFEKVTGCKLIEGYGLTESSPVVAANPLFGVNKTGTIGQPLPGTILEVVSLEDRVTLMGVGEIGEICIRGPQVMKGYWNKPEETENVLRDGRLHTGDIGKLDEDGYFAIVDRLKEMIITCGYNVYPRNIEEMIYLHEDVVEAAVIGIHNDQRGQVVKAFVVKKEGSTLTELQLREFLKEKLAPFEVPSKVEFRDALPKTLIGKIDKKTLVSEEKK